MRKANHLKDTTHNHSFAWPTIARAYNGIAIHRIYLSVPFYDCYVHDHQPDCFHNAVYSISSSLLTSKA